MRWTAVVLALATIGAGCALGPRAPECDPGMTVERGALTCRAAVDAALQVVPNERPRIERVQFLYGSATPWRGGVLLPEDEESPVLGYVVFTYATGLRDYVDVTLWHGTISVGEPLPY